MHISHRQHISHRGDRSHARLRHQQPRFFFFLRRFRHGLVERGNRASNISLYPEQIFAPPALVISTRSTWIFLERLTLLIR
jgi:hypothetical protein